MKKTSKKILSDKDLSFWGEFTENIGVKKSQDASNDHEIEDLLSENSHYVKPKVNKNNSLPADNDFESLISDKTSKAYLEHGSTDNIDKNTAQKFTSGNMDIEARLDLHGFTLEPAYNKLYDFINRCYERKLRCLLVITGKGTKKKWPEESTGILREMVPKWLNEPAFRSKILSFSYAKTKDGGDGALYILLKRIRDKQPDNS